MTGGRVLGVRVLIATTDGPSEVQRVGREDADLQSVICLNGKAHPLPISRAYDTFVRKPTGIVERRTGHPVYRTDVSQPITHGHSWQVGLLMAHILHNSDQLARPGADVRLTLWATGEVDQDFVLHPVQEISTKIARSQAEFAKARRAGSPVLLVVPKENEQEARNGLDALGIDGAGIKLLAATNVSEIEAGMAIAAKPKPISAALAASVFVLVGVAIAALVPVIEASRTVSDWMALHRDNYFVELAIAQIESQDLIQREECLSCRLALFGYELFVGMPVPLSPPTVSFTALLSPASGICPTSENFGDLARLPAPIIDNSLVLSGIDQVMCALELNVDAGDGAGEVVAFVRQEGASEHIGVNPMILPAPDTESIKIVVTGTPENITGLAEISTEMMAAEGVLDEPVARALVLAGGRTAQWDLMVVYPTAPPVPVTDQEPAVQNKLVDQIPPVPTVQPMIKYKFK